MILHNKYTRLLLLFFCIATTSCSIIPADNPKEVDFELHGHRGARGLAPENTIPAFRKAVLFNVHSLELDIVVSKDSQIVISHEPSFNPVFTTLPNGLPLSTSAAKAYNFYKMNYDEIRRFDVGLRIHPDFPEQETQAVFKPTLKEMVLDIDSFTDSLGKKRVHFNIDIKSSSSGYDINVPNPQKFIRLLLDLIKELGIHQRCIVQSFDLEVLKELHLQDPSITISVLTTNKPTVDQLIESLGFTPAIWAPSYFGLTRATVQTYHRKNIRVIPWTVNESRYMENLIAIGVDGLITDYPNRYQAIAPITR